MQTCMQCLFFPQRYNTYMVHTLYECGELCLASRIDTSKERRRGTLSSTFLVYFWGMRGGVKRTTFEGFLANLWQICKVNQSICVHTLPIFLIRSGATVLSNSCVPEIFYHCYYQTLNFWITNIITPSNPNYLFRVKNTFAN